MLPPHTGPLAPHTGPLALIKGCSTLDILSRDRPLLKNSFLLRACESQPVCRRLRSTRLNLIAI